MIVALLLTIAFAFGVDPRRLALLAGAVWMPVPMAAVVGLHWMRARPRNTNESALFCEGVASELRAGATLRDALAIAATSDGSVSISNIPMSEVAARVAEAYPEIGRELRLLISAAARSGSDAAALFDEIGSLALAQSEIEREVRIATAPGRATALVLLGAPLFYLGTQAGSGGLAGLLASSQQRVVAVIGLGLFLTGLAGACLVLWRSSR